MIPQFSFTRVPSVKVSLAVVQSGIIQADNRLVLIGHMAATGAGVPANVPVGIDNYGDPVAAAAECLTKFGANSEIGEMVVGAISGILYSDLAIKGYPPITVIPLVSTDTSAQLAATLAQNLNQPMPYVAVPYEGIDNVAQAALQAHALAISAPDRGDNGQFGTNAFMAIKAPTATATPVGISSASCNMNFPWLRDTATIPANKTHVVAAAYAALCASLGVPFLPLNGVKVGGLVAPVSPSDWHTPGDAGTVQLGLAAGLSPLIVKNGNVCISRTITAQRTVAAVADNSYFDLQDWQVLYYYRQNVYNVASQPRYARAKGTDQKLKDLLSECIGLADTFEDLEMFQYVSKFLDQFQVFRQPGNRFAGLYQLPVNVVPGFHNKGLAITGTTQFDTLVIS